MPETVKVKISKAKLAEQTEPFALNLKKCTNDLNGQVTLYLGNFLSGIGGFLGFFMQFQFGWYSLQTYKKCCTLCQNAERKNT